MIGFRKKRTKESEIQEQSSEKQEEAVSAQGSGRCQWTPFGCHQPCPPRPCGCSGSMGPTGPTGPSGTTGATGPTAPSIYAQQGKCRNHAAFSTLQTIKQPL